MTEGIYGATDIAVLLGVTKAVVNNWLSRYSDIPEPAYEATDGRRFWTADQLDAWRVWYAEWKTPATDETHSDASASV